MKFFSRLGTFKNSKYYCICEKLKVYMQGNHIYFLACSVMFHDSRNKRSESFDSAQKENVSILAHFLYLKQKIDNLKFTQ